MIGSTTSWQLSVDRGPDWLFVRLRPSDEPEKEPTELVDRLWALVDRHFTYRLVLEMDEVELLDSELAGQLFALQRRLEKHDGTLRLCGPSVDCEETLRQCGTLGQLAMHACRLDAVLGKRPPQPR